MEPPSQSMEPPEEVFELPPSSSSPSSFRKNNAPPTRPINGKTPTRTTTIPNGDDNHLDEFEMEGLITTNAAPRGLGFSAVGAGSSNSSSRLQTTSQRAHTCLQQLFAPLMACCASAWDPRNRSRSGIALLFAAFLCMMILGENEMTFFADNSNTSKSGGRQNTNDPFSKLSSDQRTALLKKVYGTYTFYDMEADDRPKTPYMTVANAGNPFLDLPEDKFPESSWQADAVYGNHFLDAAAKLVKRGQQAIFSTYAGYGLGDVTVTKDGDVEHTMENTDARTSQMKNMFHMEEIDLSKVQSAEDLKEAAPNWKHRGGWTTQRSLDGLERRILHAIITNSDFTVVITGNWQSMGYGGNHAFQSMAGHFENLVKPIFDKLEVNLVVRAIGLPPLSELSMEEEMTLLDGGKSTLVHSLGWSSIYGSDVDMVVWDDYSNSFDDGGSAHELDDLSLELFDLFARQALLSGETTLPFIWGGPLSVLRILHEHADVDVGQLGNGLVGIQETTSNKVAAGLPWAAQYLNCPKKGMQKTCEKEENLFESKCWVDRSDVTPPTEQSDDIPILPEAVGWRKQQLKGYTLAHIFLTATIDAIDVYSEITISMGFPLPDEYWHMGEYIKNVQEKVKALDESVAPHCFQLQQKMNLPKRLCQNKLQGRTEFTPRANPAETSVRSLIDISQVPKTMPQALYEGKDVKNPLREIPEGEVDALEIIGLHGKRRRRERLLMASNFTNNSVAANDIMYINPYARSGRRMESITPGDGWELRHSYGDGCDGSLSSSTTCGRLSSSNCLLEGHQGSRGGIWGNEATSWLVLQHIKPENGFIALNLEIGGREQTGRRALLESLSDSFVFEYAVDGAIKSFDKSQFLEEIQQSVPGMGLLVVLDDETVTEAKEVAVAVRVKGCADSAECQFALTHVYWS